MTAPPLLRRPPVALAVAAAASLSVAFVVCLLGAVFVDPPPAGPYGADTVRPTPGITQLALDQAEAEGYAAAAVGAGLGDSPYPPTSPTYAGELRAMWIKGWTRWTNQANAKAAERSAK